MYIFILRFWDFFYFKFAFNIKIISVCRIVLNWALDTHK